MMQILTSADFRAMPWANGGGVTCELFRLPHPARADAFAVRLSIADVAQGGPFSFFPGVERALGLLEGEGMELGLDDGRQLRLDAPGQVVAFPGEAAVQCRLLGGALRDCNLMVARDWGEGELRRHDCQPGATLELAAADLTLVYLEQGRWQGLPDAPCLLVLQDEALSLQAQSPGLAWVGRLARV